MSTLFFLDAFVFPQRLADWQAPVSFAGLFRRSLLQISFADLFRRSLLQVSFAGLYFRSLLYVWFDGHRSLLKCRSLLMYRGLF